MRKNQETDETQEEVTPQETTPETTSDTESQPGVKSGVLTEDGRLGGPNWPKNEDGSPKSVPAEPSEEAEA